MLSSKFQLTRKFFKHLDHFIDVDFKLYAQHVLEQTPRQILASPKVTMQRASTVQASHHTELDWVERWKCKWMVLKDLVELDESHKFMNPDGTMNGDECQMWKQDHRVSSGMYNLLLYVCQNQYVAERLTNKQKLKCANEFQGKFPHMLEFF